MRLLRFSLGAILLFVPVLPGGNVGNGSNTCPASGNKQISSTNTPASWVNVQAPSANTGYVYFGGLTTSTTSGDFITPGGSKFFPTAGNAGVYNLANIRFACTVTADTITFTYLQ